MASQPEPDEIHTGNVVQLAPIHRRAPHAQEIEVCFVSIALIDPKRAFQAAAEVSLTKDDFYFPSHAIIFEILLEFWQENEPMTSEILIMTLKARKVLENTGGTIKGVHLTGHTFIFELETMMPTVHVAEQYAEIIKEKANRRKASVSLGKIHETGYDESTPYAEWLSSAERALVDIVRMREGYKIKTKSVDELVKAALDEFEASLERKEPELPTGIRMLDHHTGGLTAPEIWVIMARSTRGKSALAVNIMEHLAVDRGKRVGYLSLEMGAVQLISRMIFSRAALNKKEIQNRKYATDEERALLERVSVEIAQARNRIMIREDGGLTPSEMSATATAWKSKHGLDVLFIDHAQLARGDGRSNGRTEEVEAISRSMAPLAKRLGIPIVILSQVSVKEATASTPEQYSSKNSKALEEDADKLIVITHTDEGSFLKIAKNRDGERNIMVPVIWSPETQRFSDREEPKAEQPELVDMGPASKRKKKTT